MITIHKYSIPMEDNVIIDAPKGANWLIADLQHGSLMAWALVDTTVEFVPHAFKIKGTGHDCSDLNSHYKYLNTLQNGPFVWHIFVFGGR